MDRKPIADSIADELLVDAEVLQHQMKQAKGLSSFIYWTEIEDVKEIEVIEPEVIEVADEPAPSVDPELSEVRELYKKKMGKQAYHGWSAEELIEKMNQK